MKWPTAEALATSVPPSEGYRYELLSACPGGNLIALANSNLNVPRKRRTFLRSNGASDAAKTSLLRLHPCQGRRPRPAVLRSQARLSAEAGDAGRRGPRVRRRDRMLPLSDAEPRHLTSE